MRTPLPLVTMLSWVAASCNTPPTTAPPAVVPVGSGAARTPPVDAAPDGADACGAVGLACRASPHQRWVGHIEVRADPTTLRGELIVIDASKAPQRHLFVRARPSACETIFVFDGYAPADSTLKGKPVARADNFKRGQIVARLGRSAGVLRLAFDSELRLGGDFDRGTWVDGYDCE